MSGLLGNLCYAVIEYILLMQLASACGTILRDLVGQTPTHTPQPMQSSGDTAMVYL